MATEVKRKPQTVQPSPERAAALALHKREILNRTVCNILTRILEAMDEEELSALSSRQEQKAA